MFLIGFFGAGYNKFRGHFFFLFQISGKIEMLFLPSHSGSEMRTGEEEEGVGGPDKIHAFR